MRFFFAALAAFLMFLRAALLCLSLDMDPPLMALEVLHRALMGLGLLHTWKGAQIAALAGLCILLARVQTVLARLQFANHLSPPRLFLR